MGVLKWIDHFFTSAAHSAVNTYLNVIHWALKGITSLVFGQFLNTAGAWLEYYARNNYITRKITEFADSVWHAFEYTLHVRIPGIIKWAVTGFHKLESGLSSLGKLLLHWVSELRSLITSTAKALEKWVLSHVWAPLYAYARKIYADLLKWGYTAWWWVTHPDKLADYLIFHIAASLEKNAWALAGILGKFTLSLIRRNVKKVALLIEDIVTAVI